MPGGSKQWRVSENLNVRVTLKLEITATKVECRRKQFSD